MPTFNDFRSGPGAAIAKRIFGVDAAALESWKDFHAAVVGAGNEANFVDRLLTETPKLSSSERALALALIYSVGYGETADEIGGNFLRGFKQCTGSHRTAALAFLEQKD